MASSYLVLLKALTDLLGLTHRVAFFETGELIIEGRRVALQCDECDGEASVVFYTFCPAPDPWNKAAVHRQLLEASFLWAGTGAATFGVSPNSGQIVLCARLPLAILTAEGAREVIIGIARLADFWMAACNRLQRDATPPARPTEILIAC